MERKGSIACALADRVLALLSPSEMTEEESVIPRTRHRIALTRVLLGCLLMLSGASVAAGELARAGVLCARKEVTGGNERGGS
jgi:hypothetical protein